METEPTSEALLFRETERPLRVLVIDTDKSVRDLLETVLRAEGMTVDTTECPHEARSLIARQPYELLMIEEGIPSRHGIELLEGLRASGVETPALIMTAYPTAEMLDSAFDAGASDFIKKPFAGIAHLVSRACLVAEQGTADRFYERLVSDLSASARMDSPAAVVFKRALKSCKETRALLERRPAAVIVDRDATSAASVAAILEEDGHTVEIMEEPARALARITDPRGPLVLIVDLAVGGALSTVARARATNAPPEIMVIGGAEHLFDALQGVDLGASDYCLRDEKREALARRASRAVDRARKHILKREVLELVRRVSMELEALEGRVSEPETEPENAGRRAAPKQRAVAGKRATAAKRFSVDLPAIITPEKGSRDEARVRDVSSTGMFISTSTPHPRGTRLRVYLDATPLGVSRPLETACVVRWNVRYDPDPTGASGMGVSLADNETDGLAPLLERLWRG